MSAPLQPPMLHYAVYTNYGRLDVVTDHRIEMTQKEPKWIEVREYTPDVEKSGWDAYIRPIWIRAKRINLIKYIETVKPKSEGFKP